MERQLINYLPYQVREFKEYRGITTGEQPEFELAWNCYQEVFDNQFIDTAGDYGLSRWEKMLGITPKATDSLDDRRLRIKARLNNFTPYTIRTFLRKMAEIAEGEPFEVYLEPGTYLMQFILQWKAFVKVETLQWMIDEIIPENIAIYLEADYVGQMTSRHGLHGGHLMEIGADDVIHGGLNHYAGLTGGTLLEFWGSDHLPGNLERRSGLTMAGMAELWGDDGLPCDMTRGAALTGGTMVEMFTDSGTKGRVEQ